MKKQHAISFISVPRPEGWDIDDSAMADLREWLCGRVAWILLIAYALLLVKPAMPVLIDDMAHTFWNEQHMLTVHEVNGAFHMHNDMAKAEKQEKQKHATEANADTHDCIIEDVPLITLDLVQFATVIEYNLFRSSIISAAQFFDYPPPRFLLQTAGMMSHA